MYEGELFDIESIFDEKNKSMRLTWDQIDLALGDRASGIFGYANAYPELDFEYKVYVTVASTKYLLGRGKLVDGSIPRRGDVRAVDF